MISIGVIGGIASGKSTVCRLLEARGVLHIDADAVVRDLYLPGGAGAIVVAGLFGPSILDAAGAVDRRSLADIAFNDVAARDALAAVIWPLVRASVEVKQAHARRDDVAVLAIEAPLLLEAGWRDLVDEVWLVQAPLMRKFVRVIERSGLTEEETLRHISAVPDDQARAEQADVIIDNDDGVQLLRAQVNAALDAALTRAAG